MYNRDVKTGTVGWNPTYTDIAAGVMAEHPDCPADSADDVKAREPFDVDNQTAQEIKDEYRRRVKADPDIDITNR